MKPIVMALILLMGASIAHADVNDQPVYNPAIWKPIWKLNLHDTGETWCWWGKYGETHCNIKEATEDCIVDDGKSYCYTGRLDADEK